MPEPQDDKVLRSGSVVVLLYLSQNLFGSSCSTWPQDLCV